MLLKIFGEELETVAVAEGGEEEGRKKSGEKWGEVKREGRRCKKEVKERRGRSGKRRRRGERRSVEREREIQLH